MTHTRRTVLLGALAVAGCAGQTGPQILSTVASDAKLVADALAAALPNIGTIFSGATLSRIRGYVSEAQSVAGSLGSAVVSTSTSLVTQFTDTVRAALAALATVQLPGKLSGILADIQLLLPIIQIAAGILLPLAGPRAADPGSVEAARLRLRAFALGG